MSTNGKSNERIILVTGATGQQGSAAAHHLLEDGWRVRAMTRNVDNPAAKALSDLGAEVVRGDFDDRPSLDRALQGVYGVFSVQNFWLPGVGAEGEMRQGKAIADAAKAAGVKHFVYTSVGGADRKTGIPHFDSKAEIERHIQALGLPATILRPVYFMSNYSWSRPAILNGMFIGLGLRPATTLQVIAVEDIGAFTAMAFAGPEEYIGKGLELAGDELTETQIAATFSRVIGRPVQLVPPPEDSPQRTDPEWTTMLRWFDEKGYEADIPALRRLYPPLKTLETWLRETGWENAQPAPHSAAQARV